MMDELEKIKIGLDLASVLAADVPITVAARRRLDDAYLALEQLKNFINKDHS